jgi:hypothetical protein
VFCTISIIGVYSNTLTRSPRQLRCLNSETLGYINSECVHNCTNGASRSVSLLLQFWCCHVLFFVSLHLFACMSRDSAMVCRSSIIINISTSKHMLTLHHSCNSLHLVQGALQHFTWHAAIMIVAAIVAHSCSDAVSDTSEWAVCNR